MGDKGAREELPEGKVETRRGEGDKQQVEVRRVAGPTGHVA